MGKLNGHTASDILPVPRQAPSRNTAVTWSLTVREGLGKMRRMLIRVIVLLAVAATGIFAVLLIINILLFFKLKSMYR